jgi:competence protein ComEA
MKRIFCCVALLLSFLPNLLLAAQAPQDEELAEMVAEKSQVDINKADAETLALALEGIGLSKAREIVAHRERFGEFKTIDDLEQVRGIGPATIARNRDKILIVSKE